MWLVRLSGFPPFTWVNYAFGLTGIRIAPYVADDVLRDHPRHARVHLRRRRRRGRADAAAAIASLLIVTAVGAMLVSAFIAQDRHAGDPRAGRGRRRSILELPASESLPKQLA